MVARRVRKPTTSSSSSDVSSPDSSNFDKASIESQSWSEVESTDSTIHHRHRWRRLQTLATTRTNLRLPSVKPASTWITRENQFEHFRSSLLALPVPDGVKRIQKAKGYSLHVLSVLNMVLPDSLLQQSTLPASRSPNRSDSEGEEPLLTVGIHVSLFHAESKRFFGNTWVSPERAVDPFAIKQTRDPKDGALRYVLENAPLNFRAYFISDIVDANCLGVLELVAHEKDPDAKASVRVAGCGWMLLPLFARQPLGQETLVHASSSFPSAFASNTTGDSVSVFAGSPRTLWELAPDAWSAQPKHDGSKCYYQLGPYDPILRVAPFVRTNELVGALDPIPGLKNGNMANLNVRNKPDTHAQASYDESLASFVKLASVVPTSIQVEEPFALNVVGSRVTVNLRDEIEANLVARMKISRKAKYEGAISVEGEVSARVLKLALHNGRCFRTRQFTVPLKAPPSGGDTLFCVRNHAKLRDFIFHPNMAIVVVLQYTVHFRIIWPSKLKQQALEASKRPLAEEDVVLATMGARAFVPSDGKKLYLYDKCQLATATVAKPRTQLHGVALQEQEAQRRMLHVDLLSGAPCRPYSDNVLYTPPYQLTRSLHNREVSLNDSFAFCDLTITTDENVPATEQSKTQVTTPFARRSDASEAIQDRAADLWMKQRLNKAKDHPALAQTLNELAPSPNNAKKTVAESPSPTKKPLKRPIVATTQATTQAPTSELSRASKTLLTRYGYMSSHDKPRASHSNNPKQNETGNGRPNVERGAKSIETEVNDPFKANEIRLHFAAYRACRPGTHVTTGPSALARVYFTFQFYHFPPTRSETLRLSQAFDNGASGDVQTYLLMRNALATTPALAIQFDVDTTARRNPLETRGFAEYLKWHNLYVDVWDADSLFQLGTIAIPLHELLRQGNEVKKFQAEVDIIPPLEADFGSRDDSAVFGFPASPERAKRSASGSIQLLMSCYGVKGEHFIDQRATEAQQVTAVPTDELQPQPATHCVRARPLVESNAELYRLLSQKGCYSENTIKDLQKRKTPPCRSRQSFNSNASTLTPQEIDILCDRFGAHKSTTTSTDHSSTRIKCDVEGNTGLLALLSLHPIEADSTDVKSSVPMAAASNQLTHVAAWDHNQRFQRAMNLTTHDYVALANACAVMDIAQDGHVSLREFIQAMRSFGSMFEDLSDKVLKRLVSSLNTTQNGKVAYRELIEAVKELIQLSRIEWRDRMKCMVQRAMDNGIPVYQVFADLDVSKKGKLSVVEFERGLNRLAMTTHHDKEGLVQILVAGLDRAQDGTIPYTELLESLGLSLNAQDKEIVNKAGKNMTEDVGGLTKRVEKQGISVQEIFEHFDPDQTGTASRSKTLSDRQCSEEMGHKLLLHANANEVDATKSFTHVDPERTSVTTKEEFVEAIEQLSGVKNVAGIETVASVKPHAKDNSESVSREEFPAMGPASPKTTDFKELHCVEEMEQGANTTEYDVAKGITSPRATVGIPGDQDPSVLDSGGVGMMATETPLVRQRGCARLASGQAFGNSLRQIRTESPGIFVLSKEATKGLSRLKQLLHTALEKGVAIQQAFNHFDKQGKRMVSYSDFITGLRELGPDFVTLSDQDIIAMAKTLDGKQQNGLCVDDLLIFLNYPDATGRLKHNATANAQLPQSRKGSPALERPAKTPQTQLSDTKCSRAFPIVQRYDKRVELPSCKTTLKSERLVADDLACNYNFHTDPEIRAVEQKLRQMALEAYGRGVLPLRVVTKFLEEPDDRRGQISGVSGREQTRKKRSELLRVEFYQVLMELGFTLLSETGGDRGGMYQHGPKMNDHLYARKIERLARYRQHVKSDSNKAHKQLIRAVSKTTKHQQCGNQEAKDSHRQFEDEKTQLLRVLSYYRDGQKKSLVHSLLRRQVTTSLTLFPSFGDLLFFELPLRNLLSHNDRFKIELLLPSSRDVAVLLDLEIVRKVDEWRFYRDNLPLAFGDIVSNAHIEDEMIDDQDEVFLESNDQLQIPLRLRWLDTTDRNSRQEATIPVSIVIKSCCRAHTVALFKIELQPQPFTCHRVLRFSHPALSIWRWKLKYPRGKFIVCMDPSVAMEELRDGQDGVYNNGIVSFKCRVGDYPALKTFFIVLYDDKYYARVYQVWQVRIQSKLRVDVHAILGQTVRHELVIKADGVSANPKERTGPRHVMCFTPMNYRDVLQFRPAQVFALVPQALNRIEFAFCAVETNAVAEMVVLVNLVDVETHELVGAWSIHVTLALPVITKTYELILPIDRAVQKKIAYSNPWDQPQTIRLRSSAPTLLVPRDPVLQLPCNGQSFLRLSFTAQDHLHAACQDVYLFINDKRTDQNEECLRFQVKYV